MSDEAFEFFMEVKNKEIQELKDKLERNNAAANAMINAGMVNRKKMKKAGEDLVLFIFSLTEAPECPSKNIPKRNELLAKWHAITNPFKK